MLPAALAPQSARCAAISVVLVTVVPLPCDANATATPATAADADPDPADCASVDACAAARAPFHASSVVRVTWTADHGATPAKLNPTAAPVADPSPVAAAVTAVVAFMHVARLSCSTAVADDDVPAVPPPVVAATATPPTAAADVVPATPVAVALALLLVSTASNPVNDTTALPPP